MFLFGNSKKKAYLLEWQNVILTKKSNKLITTESQLRIATQQTASSLLAQINDTARTVQTTLNPSTFFYRLSFLVQRSKELCKLEPYMKYSGPSPTDAFNEILSNYQKAIAEFMERYYYDTVDKAEAMKTEKGRRKKYQDAFSHLSSHFDVMSEENRKYVLEKFKPKAEL